MAESGGAAQDQQSVPVPTVVVAAVVPPPTAEAPAVTKPLPFRQLDSDEMARVVLQQTDPTHFQLMEGFRYMGAAGTWTVRPSDLPDTDLASIPPFLSWFTSRYGTHTLAALLHDHLVRNGDELDPKVARSTADDVFRTALDELDVPFLRARIMWTAVTLATRWRGSVGARLAIAGWMTAATLGVVGLVLGALTLNPVMFGIALLAPIPFAILWSRRQYRAGVVGGYTLWFVAMPALMNLGAYGLYNVAERGVRWLLRLRPANRDKPIPGPPPYTAR